MEIEQLKSMCEKQEGMGLDRLILRMPVPKSWRDGGGQPRQVRSPFGLCHYNWSHSLYSGTEYLVIWPTVKQVRAYIEKVENEIFYRVVMNRVEGWVGIHKFTLKTENDPIDPNLDVVPRKFYSSAEACRAMNWAVEQIKKESDPAPSTGSSQETQS